MTPVVSDCDRAQFDQPWQFFLQGKFVVEHSCLRQPFQYINFSFDNKWINRIAFPRVGTVIDNR